MKEIWERLQNIGQTPICNGIPERAPSIFGYTFLFCYRCTFTGIGAIMGLILIFGLKLYKKLNRVKVYKQILIVFILLLPMIIDGSLQYFIGIESDNIRRSVTGFIAGIGIICGANLLIERITIIIQGD